MTPLGRLIAQGIAAQGPIGLDTYMGLCLGHPEHGYYATRDPLGADGDFITAPEISQMFGELIGAWLAQAWDDQGRPPRFVLAELGPGRGTLMRDALRAARAMPGFLAASELWLVETSPALRARQAELLPDARWARSDIELPDGPLLLVANEFFDALPIRQFQRVGPLWRERMVGLGDGGALRLLWGAPRGENALEARFAHTADGAVIEIPAAGEAVASRIGARIAGAGGAALILDYGAWDGTGDTFQAVRGHAPTDPLAEPGAADLTAHVRFRALAEASPARAYGPLPQGALLARLGIDARAGVLAARHPARAEAITAAHRRLTHPAEMGEVFKAIALVPGAAPAPPGFAS